VKRLVLREAVPNLDAAVAHDADDITGICRIHTLSVLRHKGGGIVQAHGLPAAVMNHLHALLERARAHPHERHAIVVLRVHVGLDLKGHARKLLLVGRHRTGDGRARLGPRGDLDERVEHISHPKIAERTPKEDRRLLSGQVGLQVQFVPRFPNELHVEAQVVGLVAQHVVELRILEIGNGQALVLPLHVRVREEVQLIAVQVVRPPEPIAHPNGPGQRHRVQVQRLLDVLQDIERRQPVPVHLVDERNDGGVLHPAHLHQLLRLLLHAAGVVEHHNHAVHRREHAVRVLRKVAVARRIQ
jgi:hypothetical protein